MTTSDDFTLEDAKWWFDKNKVIAVVGFSKNPAKAAHYVPMYMRERGFKVIPVNPNYDKIGELQCYHRLEDIPVKVDIVNVFRPSHELPELLDQALAIGASGFWAQLGITNETARAKALQHEMRYVEDRCMMVEHRRWAPMLEKERK